MEEKKIRGVRLKTFNYAMIVVSAILAALLIIGTVDVASRYEEMRNSTERYIACQRDAAQVEYGSDELTEQARLFAMTGQSSYALAYFKEADVTKNRDLALEDLVGMQVVEELESELRAAVSDSNKLMEREIYAMRLICDARDIVPGEIHESLQQCEISPEDDALSPEEKMELGRVMLCDEEYQKEKSAIIGHLEAVVENAVSITRQHQLESQQALSSAITWQRTLIILLFLIVAVTFVFITMLVVHPLSIYIRNIQEERLIEMVGAYEFKYLAFTYNSIYELNATNESLLKHAAEHDPLTGALNRRAFDRMTMFLRASDVPMALLYLDMDKFKEINDSYGHDTGDAALKKVASLLQEQVRSTDKVIRFGGDEFGVLMTEIRPEQQNVILEKVREVNRRLQNPEDGLPPLSISVGAAFSLSGYCDELYQNADRALYEVKKCGRIGCRISDKVVDPNGSEGEAGKETEKK